MVFEIRFAEGTLRELLDVPVFHRRRVVEDIAGELSASPATPSRTRKLLVGVVSPWDRGRPVWQLRVGEYRVFYDVDPEQRRVTIQAIRRKGRKSTEEIL